MTQLFAYVNDAQVMGAADGTSIGVQATKRGEVRVTDFYTQMLLQGRTYQVRAGTITTPVASNAGTVDTAAEMSVDAVAGTTIIPVSFRCAIRDLATTTIVEVFIKAVGVVSSSGTAFVPLPLVQGGPAAVSTARVANAGGVTVTAELATTTRRLFEWSNVSTETPASATGTTGIFGSIVAAAQALRYVGKGAACVYVQIGGTTAAPLHFGSLDYIELPSANL